MDTPIYDHIKNYPSVYEPYEDTFLVLDALESELPFLKSLNANMFVEIGSGSGVNITALAKSLGSLSGVYLATDINKEACRASVATSRTNNVSVEVFNMNFLDLFRKHLFDVILFNPPYVVSDPREISGFGIERSYAGGNNGREVMDKLFPKLPDLLAKNGVFYLVVIQANKPNEIMDIMHKLQFKCEILKERRILGEHLFVLKFQNNVS